MKERGKRERAMEGEVRRKGDGGKEEEEREINQSLHTQFLSGVYKTMHNFITSLILQKL